MFLQFFKNRFNIMILISLMLAVVLAGGLANVQLVNGGYYNELAQKRLYKSVSIKAPRGEIVDRYGRPLVTNRIAFSVIINEENLSEIDLNNMLLKLLQITQTQSGYYEDNLPITIQEPYEFRFDQGLPGAGDKAKWIKDMSLSDEDTPSTVLDKLANRYKINTKQNEADKRAVVGLRYDMAQRMFGIRNPFLFLTDAGIELVTIIKENSRIYPGVTIASEPLREYPDISMASHILGNVDVIYKEEYDKLKDAGYAMSDTVGKAGMEKYLEKYLRGQNGRNSIEYNLKGDHVKVADSIPPKPGSMAVLTIDSNLQKVAEDTLKDAVTSLRNEGVSDVSGGAVVAIEVGTGEVLAMATYPTFNPATFKKEYSKLLKDPYKPMLNRAIGGTYAPGSTFKVLTALAGLQEGIITPNKLIDCKGIYDFYAPSYTPACWIWNDYHGTHGPINVVKALEVSCNYYFFETGRLLTIDKIDDYAKHFGLGTLTGIELIGEQQGALAGPENRKIIRPKEPKWYPGDTLQAAIGQSDHLFTPLQIANYIATVASGGKRYSPHLLKKVLSYDGKDTLEEKKSTLVDEAKLSPEVLKTVYDGMNAVTTDGSAKKVYNGATFSVCAKTGTAQVPHGTPNSLFVSFAPKENPQVAIACIVEHGGKNGLGYHIAGITRKMFEEYFFGKIMQKDVSNDNVLLP